MVPELISLTPVGKNLTGVHLTSMNQPLRLKYVTDGCLLLINPKGRIRVLYTPFRVQTIISSFGIPENTWVYVEAVFEHQEYIIGYLINGAIHPFKNFKINVSY
ncbi:MAG: hypothetical protein ACOYLT_10500 [Flavobacterium sp.]|uniref:hypothetical protein n=1 Tax=Flavobacterium sp. TaxID=239 RepID=UPI003BDAA373